MDIMYERVLSLIGTKRGAGQELVKALGLAKNTVTEWKAGRSKSYTKYAPQIAAYYGVSLDWLSGATDEKEQKNSPAPTMESEADLTRKRLYEKLDSWEIEKLEKLVAFLELLGET